MALQLLLILALLLSPQPLMALQLQLLSDTMSSLKLSNKMSSLILSEKMMSPRLSLKALESVSAKLSPVVSQIIEVASGLIEEDKDTALIKFVLDSISKIDDLVLDFIKHLRGDDDNEGILKAYNDATLKCKMAAANINRETSSSYTELKILQGALNHMDKHGNNDVDALEEIKRLESPKFNLPNSLISDLEAVKTAYEVVIGLCAQKVEAAQWHIVSALIVGLIVLGVVLSSPVSAGPKTFTYLILGSTVLIAKRIKELIALTSNLKRTQMHVGGLRTTFLKRTQMHVGGLIVGISKIQIKVEALQIALQSTWEITASAHRIKDLSELRDPTFRFDLELQISDLNELKLSGRQLTKNAEKSFEFLERHYKERDL